MCVCDCVCVCVCASVPSAATLKSAFVHAAFCSEVISKTSILLQKLQCEVCKMRIIIMYIYHVLINALSAHMIHINLNMIFCTHIEHCPTKTT